MGGSLWRFAGEKAFLEVGTEGTVTGRCETLECIEIRDQG